MGNKLICLLGGAAVGKDTIRNKLLEKHEDLIEATSHTTRPMRATENGSEYYFIQEEERMVPFTVCWNADSACPLNIN